MKNLIRKILKEQDWYDDIVNKFNDLDYSKKVYDIDELKSGDNIFIDTEQDGMEISSNAVVVEKKHGQILIRLPDMLESSDSSKTHCGSFRDSEIQKKCKCQDLEEDIGYCWWIDNTGYIQDVRLYPNKKGFNYINFGF